MNNENKMTPVDAALTWAKLGPLDFPPPGAGAGDSLMEAIDILDEQQLESDGAYPDIAARILATEVRRLRELTQWRPIESAPKNAIILALTNQGETVVAYNEEGGGWHEEYTSEYPFGDDTLTHWMPIPAAPKSEVKP